MQLFDFFVFNPCYKELNNYWGLNLGLKKSFVFVYSFTFDKILTSSLYSGTFL